MLIEKGPWSGCGSTRQAGQAVDFNNRELNLATAERFHVYGDVFTRNKRGVILHHRTRTNTGLRVFDVIPVVSMLKLFGI